MARAPSAAISSEVDPGRTLDSWGVGNDRVGNYFVAFFETADAEVVAFASLFAPKLGLPAGIPGPMFGCSVGPVSDNEPPQPENPQRPSTTTPTA
ncbi:hypothetical protein SAMN05444166_7778 [Singulisphaera sp. GP187]|nr:hypothetical protein SAMN05444166_7778 [Singulisphaera sp. GP187]